MKIKKLVIFIGIIIFIAVGVCFLIYTTAGSKFAADIAISKFIDHEELIYKNLEGSLYEGMTFKNLEVKDIRELPEGSTLKIQKLFLNLTSFSLNGLNVETENVRLKLPDSDPIVMSGSFKKQQLDLNIFSKGVTVREVLGYIPDFKLLIPIKGEVNGIDLYITGHYLEPTVKGTFEIDQFIYKGFLLSNAPVSVDINLTDVRSDVKIHGNVLIKEGELQTNKVLITLGSGNLKFSGPWNQPELNIKGNAKVEKAKIQITLKGTIEDPKLNLSSDPAYTKQKLMVMLATGKSWQSVEDSIDNGFNSAALTKDFIDYFFFAGKSNQFAEKFGISEFSVKFDENRKGISAKKEITDKLEIGYGVEQSNGEDESKYTSQKIEGEVKVTDRLSVGVERESKKLESNGLLDEQLNQNNDKIMLKYKKSF